MKGWLITAALLFGCGDNLNIAPAPDAGSGALTGCLERPEDLLTPPGDTLPCELIPPGLVLGD